MRVEFKRTILTQPIQRAQSRFHHTAKRNGAKCFRGTGNETILTKVSRSWCGVGSVWPSTICKFTCLQDTNGSKRSLQPIRHTGLCVDQVKHQFSVTGTGVGLSTIAGTAGRPPLQKSFCHRDSAIGGTACQDVLIDMVHRS